MSDLVDFLNARLAEDAAIAGDARKALKNGARVWSNTHPDISAHIARQHPERVRGEVFATRRIIGLHARDHQCVDRDWSGEYGYTQCSTSVPCLTLISQALRYADHPDFDPDWSPDPGDMP